MNTVERTVPEISKIPRHYLPESFTITDWAAIEPYFIELQDRKITSAQELERWMLDRSELESVLSEDMGWRYIKMTCDTQNEEITEAFQYFINEIEPKIAPYDHELNKKLIDSPFLGGLDQEKYRIYLRSVKKALEIFREENIPLNTFR
jgi:oligoendopeptidase F